MNVSRQDRQENPAGHIAVPPSEASFLAASLHGSLSLTEILRACRRSLQQHLHLDRLSLVQHRANESTATLYSLDETGSAPLIGPKVIALESSRLQRCIADHEMRVIRFTEGCAQDGIEQRHLLPRHSEVAVYSPLLVRGKFKGVLVLAMSKQDNLNAGQMSVLSYTAEHLALAIENSDMHYLECRRGRQLSMVSEIARQAVLVEDLEPFLRDAAELIRLSLDYLEVQIWTATPLPDGLAMAARACRSNASSEGSMPEMVEECGRQHSTQCNNNVCEMRSGQPGSELAVPVRLRGRALGVLYLRSDRLDAFPAEDIDTMEGIASLIASAYDNLRTLEHAQESNEYMQAILESAKSLAVLSTDILGFVMTSSVGSEAVLRLPQKQIVGEDIAMFFTDAGFRRELTSYIGSPGIPSLEHLKLSQCWDKEVSYLDVSLQRVYSPEKKPLGFLCIVQDVTKSVLLERQLESLSITDELTGLYNRRQFFTAITGEIERCHRFGRSISLCFFDLDRFKKFNDTHGHLQGDQALKETAQVVLSLVRSSVDTCYRYGGDEFTIIMPETTIEAAYSIAERIRVRLNRTFRGEMTASIGIASVVDSLEAEHLIERADKAMYAAKSFGGNRTILADPLSPTEAVPLAEC